MSPIPEERERINQNESKIGVEIGEKRDEEVSKLFDPLIWFRFSYICGCVQEPSGPPYGDTPFQV